MSGAQEAITKVATKVRSIDANTPLTVKLGVLVAVIWFAIAAVWYAAELKSEQERRIVVIETRAAAAAEGLVEFKQTQAENTRRLEGKMDRIEDKIDRLQSTVTKGQP